MPVIPAFKTWRQEDYEIKTSLGDKLGLYNETLSPKQTKQNNKKNDWIIEPSEMD
jgi:hypothetical protein